MTAMKRKRMVPKVFSRKGMVRLVGVLLLVVLATLVATLAGRRLYARGRYGGTIAITSVRPRPGRPHRVPFTVKVKGTWSPGEDQDADLYWIEIVWSDAGAKTWMATLPEMMIPRHPPGRRSMKLPGAANTSSVSVSTISWSGRLRIR